MKTFSLMIPTLNGGDTLERLFSSIKVQTIQPQKILIIDSMSDDNTVNLAKKYDVAFLSIERKAFNHGGTRQMAVNYLKDSDVIVFLTQDAYFANNTALGKIVDCFENENVCAAYGRQLPHTDAGPLGAHARLFNYGALSHLKSLEDSKTLGIKVAFISNSFAAYRRESLNMVGGFPSNLILSEDTFVASKLLLQGKYIAYCSEATVYHSHDYNYQQEFKRYFDIGVFHAREAWIREAFGQAEGEGIKFVLSEWRYLLKNGFWWLIPSAIFRTGLKWIGYRLGLSESKLSVNIKRKLSMHRQFWI